MSHDFTQDPQHPAFPDDFITDAYRHVPPPADDLSDVADDFVFDFRTYDEIGDGQRWTTVGVSPNIIEASFEALEDSLTWRLFHKRAQIIPLPSGGRRAKRG